MIAKLRKAPGKFIVLDKGMIDADDTISFKAKGILAYLMGRPENWTPNIEEIATHSCDGLGSVKSGIQELKHAGYITITRLKDEKKGTWIGWEWYVDDSYPPANKGKHPKVKNQLSDEQPKANNQLSEKQPEQNKNPHKQGKVTESQKTDFRIIDFVNNIEDNNIDLGDKKREREEGEKASRAKSPQEEIYVEVFGEQNFRKLTILQQQQLSLLDDLELLRTTCQWWAGNNYKPTSVGRLCERYHEQKEKAKEKRAPKSCQQESTFDRNLRFLGIDPATLQQVQ